MLDEHVCGGLRGSMISLLVFARVFQGLGLSSSGVLWDLRVCRS